MSIVVEKNKVLHFHTFYLIDLDRTLFDTVSAAQAWMNLVEKEDADIARYIHSQVDEALRTMTSFSIRNTIVERGGEALAQKVDRAFIEYGAIHNLRLEGADALIEFATRNDQSSAGILTFGSPDGQLLKVKVAGLDHIPALVTDQQHKGELIRSWQKDGSYHLPAEYGSVTADNIVFVDDRVFSFEGLPEDVVGYWLTHDFSVLDEVGFPENVTPVGHLQAVIEAEQERLGL